MLLLILALGWLAGVNAAFAEHGQPAPAPPETTAHGALLHHLKNGAPSNFQPMNVTFGLFPPLDALPRKTPKREKHRMLSERALADLEPFAAETRA